MSYDQAFRALKDGDIKLAVPLLEKAAQETGYSSEAVNHAYTLALYRAGAKTRLADVAFEIGDSLVETNPALALDYFQRAFWGGLDAACSRHIGEIFEGWAAAPVAPAKTLKKIVHVFGSLHEDHAPGRQVNMLVKSLQGQGVEQQVFTTEWAASWFFNEGNVPQSESSISVPGAVIASIEGNFIERAERIASAIRGFGADATFYHADFNEQITARVAAFRPTSIQVNVTHGAEMNPALFDGYIHLTKQGLTFPRRSAEPREWIPAVTDIDERVQRCPPNMRQAMGLESAATVSSTLGDLRPFADPAYLNALTGLLKNFPNHFHIFAGSGDAKPVRAPLHAEGVLPRVRFLGAMSDAASILAVTDVYLSPLKTSDDSSLLEAMGAGRPTVVLQHPGDPARNSSAELLGIQELIASNEAEYAQIAQQLLRSEDERARCGNLVLSRFRSQFAPDLIGPRYLQFLSRIQQAG